MFEKFTDRSRRVFVLAQEAARALDHDYLGTEHVLLGLIRADGLASYAIESLGIPIKSLERQIEFDVARGERPSPGHIRMTRSVKRLLELALQESLRSGHSHIGVEHLLLGLIREGKGTGARVLTELGVDADAIGHSVQVLTVSNNSAPEDAPPPAASRARPSAIH